MDFMGLGNCDRCGAIVSGSHYHCGGCDSLDVTGMYGHHCGIHVVAGKLTKVEFHHCAPDNCALDVVAVSDER